jgi:membrane protease YdiL (CAAX protease family)
MMYDKDSKGISYSAVFFMLIAFTIAGFFVYGVISAGLWPLLTGQPPQEMAKELSNPTYSNTAKFLQSLYAIICFFMPPLLTASLLNKRPFRLLGFSKQVGGRQIALVFFILASALFVGDALSWVNYQLPIPADWKIKFDQLEADYTKQTQAIMSLKSTGDYVVALVVMGFLPALCEETLFRGGLQNFLYRSSGNPWLAIIVASVIFSAVHFSFYGFLFRLLLGFVLGWVYHYSGKLWLSILGHFLNNALVITIFFVYMQEDKQLPTSNSFWGLALLPVLISTLLIFKRISFNTKPQ